ncbi:MAG: leader peptidase (prepilin peptidase) / N-methyltransferase [Gaiellales bacterium]|nr:leader peptidase (prepilin peptidase) / N-methyltransferase [Gaiellales bacterium]
MNATVAVLAAVGGGVAALGWPPLEPLLVRRSEDAVEQPAWTLRITARPIVAGASALACGAVGLRFGATRELVPALVLAFALVGLTAIDFRYRILPNRITYPLALAGVVLGAALRFSELPELGLAAFGAGGFLLIAALLSPSGLGMGDVKLAFVLGLFLGSSVVVAIVAGLVSSSVPALIMLLVHGRGARKMHLALGPFLALGGMLALLAGDDVISWYTGG